MSPVDTLQLLDAIRYATVAHDGQVRSGDGRPYIVHPLHVAMVLVSNGITHPKILQAAVLHDIVEDTPVTVEMLRAIFGAAVSRIVAEVTDDPAKTKKEQREHLLATASTKSLGARLVKIADAISNVIDTGDRAPADWSRSLKLAYVNTCAKVGAQCYKGGDVPLCIYEHLLAEVESARERLSKENYGGEP